MSRNLFLPLAVVLCLVLSIQAFGLLSDATQLAQQAAAAANDNAVSGEERQAALKKLSEAAHLFLSAGETVEAARVLNRVGQLQLRLNAPQDALASHNQALALLKQTPDVIVEVDTLNGLGAVYLLLKQKEQVQEVLQKSLTLSAQTGYKKGEAQALLTLSDSQNYDNHVTALQTAQKALALWQTVDDKRGLAYTYSQIGRCNMAQYLLPEATQNYEKALQVWRDLKNASEEAEVLIMLGFIEYRKGDWQRSISYMTQAQGLIDEKAEPLKMGQIAAGLAEAFNESGLPEVGLPHYQKALDYYRQTQDPHLIYIGLLGVGATHYLLGNHVEARKYFEQVLTLAEPKSLEAANGHRRLGRVSTATGDHDAALDHFQQSLAIYTSAVNPKEAAQVRGLMGQVYQRQGKLELANEHYQQALAAFVALSDHLNEAAIYFVLGQLELRQKNYDVAEKYLRQAIDVTEGIRRFSTSNDLMTAFTATVHERYETYIECLMRKHSANPARQLDVRAFETSELSRGRSLAEFLRATQTNLASGLEPELTQREKALRQSLRVKENQRITLLGREYKPEQLTALEAELARLEVEYKQVADTINARHPAYAQMHRPTGWNLSDIQHQVVADDQTVLLEYSLGEDHSYVWSVTRNDIRSSELPAEAVITKAAEDLYVLLTTPPGPEAEARLSEAIQKLSSIILSPVAAEVKNRRVIVVADGALNYIPFQILRAQPDIDEPLVAGREVINAPSASILGQLRQETTRRQAPEKLIAAFGDPIFASNYAQHKDPGAGDYIASTQPRETEGWRHALRDIELSGDTFDPASIQPLMYTQRELANLRHVAGAQTLMATGFDASREQLEKLDLAKYAILHFATHGILDPKRPENSGLFLSMVNRTGEAANGFIGLQDIYALHAPVDLVVLSACRTGLGKDVRGEGLIGLTRGFMYAGASSVVASLWKVDDEATAELMKHFYTNMLQRGMTPAAALRQAQNTIRQQPHWRSPYFWAAFTLQGDYTRVIQAPRASFAKRYLPVVLVVTALAMLAGAGWWYRRRRIVRTP